ncbi:MAG: hypothetical protein HY961_01805 [Ignavibacteriae bacterium]|nr:hypothetical protein [Ignavibacteriota bacterium]
MKTLFGDDLVNELRSCSDRITTRLWIAVPYIGGLQSVRRILGNCWMNSSNLSIRLLTDINEFNNFNSETINLFNELGEIRHLAGLHAKIFIADSTSLVTSANLTDTAFSKRHEIGVFLNDASSAKVVAIFDNWWKKSEQVSLKTLKPYAKKQFESCEEGQGSALPTLWNLPDDPNGMNYWLKPIGVTGDPITDDRLFDDVEDNLHFSKLKPNGVKVNDILIAYGIGAKRILSIYKVVSEPMRVQSKKKEEWMERWPWYVVGHNLTRHFGRNWAHHNIYGSQLIEEYLKKNPKGKITRVGGTTFGALSLGKDKIKLDPDFAQFLIQRVNKLNFKS